MNSEQGTMSNALGAGRRALSKEMPVGYKRTELGSIPEDWNIQRLDAFCSTYSGGTPSTARRDFYDGHIPWITSGDLNARRITDVSCYITQAGFDSSAAKMVNSGDIVVALYGATAGVVAVTEIEAAINQAILAISTNKCDREYLFQHLASRRDQIVATYKQGGQPNLSGKIIRSIAIVVPPPVEQRAIADALSDVDGLLRALEALIAKKWAIKQAAMQQLLTGKTRLPGFSGAWETKRLGDTFTYLPTANNPRADLREYGQVDYIHYGDVHAHAQPVLNCAYSDLPRIDKSRVDNAAHLQDGDLVVVDASEDLVGVGKSIEVHRVAGKTVVAGLHTILCRGNPDYWAMGFKAYLQFTPAFKSALTRGATGISVYAISKKQLADIQLALPSLLEQEAIVSVLSDIDAEIAALERRQDKACAIKQGMMQQLLTGRVRLVGVSGNE